MGMAASQARYLALVARKSNCEYEGQQINQARLNLSNQSANLFNQMLGLTVPIPPSTQDFTTTQYSYTDGVNSSVIDSWKQLSEANPNYNYIVKTHYFADIYTGSLKKMTDPQVQMSNVGAPVATKVQIDAALANLKVKQNDMNTKYDHWQSVKKTQEKIIADIKENAKQALQKAEVTSVINNISVNINFQGGKYYRYTESAGTNRAYDAYVFDDAGNLDVQYEPDAAKILKHLYDMTDLGVITIDEINANLLAQDPSFALINDISELRYDGISFTSKQVDLLKTYGLVKTIDTSTSTYTGDELVVTTKQLEAINSTDFSSATAIMNGYPVYASGNSDPLTKSYLDAIANAQLVIDAAEDAYYDDSVNPPTGAKVDYDNALAAYQALNQPSYIGNCELTYLDSLTDDQRTELLQVVKDMTAQGINTDILNCFDTNGNYLGGVYSFQLNGVTYYTTYKSLIDAYASNTSSNNYIDAQYKMPYYNASYINTRIDQESKALLETDGNGRFSSVRFENDSVTYTLNMETVTDDEAYQDAMNRYYYENAKYDKMIQDINAKTSIIHQQDQELELRLKQLDTEQNALSTEIDAVSKVVKDNVESSFKTFGG